MGVRVWKEVLCQGRQRDRFGNWFTIGPKQIQEAKRNAERMLGRGLNVPAVWEHQSWAEPTFRELSRDDRIAAYAKHTFGSLAGARINDRGNLDLLLDVPDTRDADQLRKTRFVSPKVYRIFSDSRGGEYRGTVIGHIASTPTPCQYWQRPFEFSQGDALYLSFTPEGKTVAKEDEDDKGGEGGADGDLKALIQALRDHGLTIPDEVSDLKTLCIAVKASSGNGGGGDDDLDLDPELAADASDTPTTTAGQSPPMLMSDDRAEPLRQMTRRDLKNRIERLVKSGRINRPTAISLWQEAKTLELSFYVDGNMAANPVVSRIEAYEKLPKGMAWQGKGTQPRGEIELSMTELDQPHDFTGRAAPQPKSELQSYIDRLLDRIPGPAKK